jgi:hypothetical protein
MKKIAMMLALGLLSTAVLCVLAPPVSAATVTKTYTDELLPDVYCVENVTFDGYINIRQDSSYPYSLVCYFQDSPSYTKNKDLRDTLKNKDSTDIPEPENIYMISFGQLVNVYLFIYADPSDVVVSTQSGNTYNLSEGNLVKRSDIRFYMYSGQQVKLTLDSSQILRFGYGSSYDYDTISPGANNITIMREGEYRLYDGNWYSNPVFASFSIEYDEPPTGVAVYGFIILVLAVVCMGLMVFFARGQKIK